MYNVYVIKKKHFQFIYLKKKTLIQLCNYVWKYEKNVKHRVPELKKKYLKFENPHIKDVSKTGNFYRCTYFSAMTCKELDKYSQNFFKFSLMKNDCLHYRKNDT